MFDVDEHPAIDLAISDAGKLGVEIAVSNPCIELWSLLHWRDQSAYLDRHAAQAAVVPLRPSPVPHVTNRLQPAADSMIGFPVNQP